MIPVHILLGQGNFIHINTDKAVLFFYTARQYYFMMDTAELALCKTVSKGSYVRKQKHPLHSSYSLVLRCEDATT